MENFILAAVPPTELTVWQCAFLGALGGLLFAAVCWYITAKIQTFSSAPLINAAQSAAFF